MTEDGSEGPRPGGFLATIRQLSSGITSEPLLFALALAVVVVLLVGLLAPGLDLLGRWVIALAALALLLVFFIVSLRATRSPSETPADPDQAPGAQVPELVIAVDGHFVGGDEVVKDLVVDLLDVPAADRSVRIRALPLEDGSYRRRDPDEFVRLRDCVRSYQLSVSRLLRGSVHYYWKWKRLQLAEAVLELRRIELPVQSDRQWWFVWPAADPGQVIPVGLDDANVRSVQTGISRGKLVDGTDFEIEGMPPDEPIWLAAISPEIVWTRVVPAVVAHRSGQYRLEDPPVLDLTGWVLSDRKPSELVRTRPCESRVGLTPQAWTW